MGKLRRRRVGLSLAAALAALAWLAWHYGSLAGLERALTGGEGVLAELHEVYLPAARALLEGQAEPVARYFYTPLLALLCAPLTLLPEGAAAGLWLGVQAAAVGGVVALALAIGGERDASQVAAFLAVSLTSLPLADNLVRGQLSTPLVALLLLACLAFEARRPRLAALLVAFAGALKYFPLLFATESVARKEWRVVALLLVALALLLAALPALVLGPGDLVAHYLGVQHLVESEQPALAAQVSYQSFAALSMRLAGGADAPEGVREGARVVGAAIAAALVVGAGLVARSGMERRSAWCFVLLFLATPFWIPTSWPHYFAYLPFAQWMLFAGWRAERREQRAAFERGEEGVPEGASARLVLVRLLLAGSVVLSNLLAFELLGGRTLFLGAGALFYANLLLLAGVLLFLAPRVAPAWRDEVDSIETAAA